MVFCRVEHSAQERCVCLYRGALGGHSHLAPSASSSSSGALFFALLGVSCVCVEHSKFLLGVWHLGGCFCVVCCVGALVLVHREHNTS